MKTKTLILLAAALAALLPAQAQQTRKLTAEKHNDYGLVYTLPKTALSIKVKAEVTVYEAGPFAEYAKKYIGVDNVITDDVKQSVLKSVEVTPYGVPDRTKEYNMQLKPGSVTYLTVADNGMLLSINAPAEAPKAAAPEASADAEPGAAPDAYLRYVGEDFMNSLSKARQAQMLAESLMEVRETKVALTRGTAENAPADGRQLGLMLSELGRQEDALMAAFTGRSYTVKTSAEYTYLPEKEGTEVFARLSDFDGFTTPDDYAGEPLRIAIADIVKPELPVDEKGKAKELPRDAVAYTLPGVANVKISYRGRTVYQKDIDMGQFGLTYGLNPTLFSDKKAPSYAVFNPATGGLSTIGPVSELTK